MNVHQRADSFHADTVPVKRNTRAIHSWKKRNRAERETSISQGWESDVMIFDRVIDVEWDVFVCIFVLLIFVSLFSKIWQPFPGLESTSAPVGKYRALKALPTDRYLDSCGNPHHA
jgi:hypothetical protein